MTITFGSLFSGIGGLDLGLERAGMVCRWQVEIDEYARRVLAKHWPDVPRFEDVRAVGASTLAPVDLICGGFPCQDISTAGKRAGITGARSGLWSEFARIVRELRPRFVLVENVSALLVRGMGRVVGDLAACGYDAEWDCIPAAAVGAPHRRDRVFLVAYPSGSWGGAESQRECWGRDSTEPRDGGASGVVADARGKQCNSGRCAQGNILPSERATAGAVQFGDRRERGSGEDGQAIPDRDGWGLTGDEKRDGAPSCAPDWSSRWRHADGCDCDTGWCIEPDVGRVAHGVPARVDRLKCLGNAVVPQVAELIGRWIVEADARSSAGRRERVVG